MGLACMENPPSLWHFYLRNKRKVLPVIGILALAILGVVVTDSLLASARETAYATYGSYQKLILVAPRATREQDLANPLAQSLSQLRDVQLKVDTLDRPGGLSAYYDAVIAIPARVRAQLPAVQQLQADAANARYYAARLRGDLVPLGDLIVRVQRLQAEQKSLDQLVQQLSQNPSGPRPLLNYLQQHQAWLQSVLPDSAQLGRLQSAVSNASSDAAGLQQSLQAMNRDTANLNTAGQSVADIPVPPSPSATIDQFKGALDRLTSSLGAIQAPQPGLDKLVADSMRIPGTAFVKRDAYSNLDINLLAGNAQFDLYGFDPPGMGQLLSLYGDRIVAGRLPAANANEIAVSEEIARSRHVWVGGLLNNLFFPQRMNEFGLLAAVGYSRWGLIMRVAWESLGVTLAAWLIGVGLGVAVLSWFNLTFIVPHGLLINIFDWNVLSLHTLPIPLMVFAFVMGTVAWQLLRLDPISIIERRD